MLKFTIKATNLNTNFRLFLNLLNFFEVEQIFKVTNKYKIIEKMCCLLIFATSSKSYGIDTGL